MSSTPLTLLVATTNPGKLAELREIFDEQRVRMIDLAEAGAADAPEAVEDGDTFEENAIRKAQHYAGVTGMLCLADDSGLEVDALAGAPGVFSARYAERDAELAGDGIAAEVEAIVEAARTGSRSARDEANNALLLSRLAHLSDASQRSARFVCVMALVRPDGTVLHTARGTFEGTIAHEPKGTGGFGYDPIVHLPDLDRRVAELSPSEKHARSHRGEAARAMVLWMQQNADTLGPEAS
ncbi:MAG: RdgB/HAM1 family non-canonical purine NTP pyrophosphatase [Planctomycetota bacterium]